MRDVDILLPELLCQALRERAHTELARRDCTRGGVPAQAGGRAGEKECAPLALVVELEALEQGDGLAGEGECSNDVGVDALLDFFRCKLKEWL